MSTEAQKVMVIGGGIAGLTTAWELSQYGIEVDLVEKGGFLGGHAIQYACKATDRCQQCNACLVESMLKNVSQSTDIKVHLATEIQNVEQYNGFVVQLIQTADKVQTMSACENDYDQHPLQCAAALGYSRHNAINSADRGKGGQLNVDAIILATGFSPFDVREKPTYRYGDLANVITGLDLERIKRAHGELLRPSDNKSPQKIAFVQCVGSRDERLGNLWCSQVCCPYALRSAMSLKHRQPELDITIFYMDIQNTGNNFVAFNEQCRNDLHFIRTIPVDMYQAPQDRVRTRFMDEADGVPVEAEFDLVVLSIGIMPGSDTASLAEKLQIELTADGFAASTDTLNTSTTARQGIFLAGTVQGPKTIAKSMAHAGQTASEVIQFLRRTA